MASTFRIVGGEDADPGQFPWTAALMRESKGWLFCGGAVISNQFILTAAHCIEDEDQDQVEVRLGAHTIVPKEEPEIESRDYRNNLIMHFIYYFITIWKYLFFIENSY